MSKLFTPIKIGSMEVRNRTFMAPMSLGYESEDGTINETLEAYFLARAEGGVGCIITDALSVDPNVPYLGNTLCFRNEESIQKYKAFTDKIHLLGAKVIPQITHPGPESISAFYNVTPVASSDYINSMGKRVRALTLDEIPSIIEKYALTSYQAKLAGFDGIELHCAHAYMLLASFLSPMRNKRSDRYGGNLDNRARLLFEVIDAIKKKCGKDFPIILRISGNERDPQGNTVEDIKYLVPQLIEHGVDAFEISGGTQYERPNKIIPCHGEQEGLNLIEAEAIAKVSSVPVIVVGKILDVHKAMNYVDSERVDGIVFGRALMADPQLVNKAKANKFDEIAPCAACVIGCVGEQSKRRPASCVINPFVGKENTMKITKPEVIKEVAIIGGGIGGMACARLLALRGHHVTIYEKEKRLGGQMNIACIPPHKQELSKWVVYLNRELARLNITTHLSHEVDSEELTTISEHVDSIVIATGANAIVPPVQGIMETDDVITAHDVLKGNIDILGGNVLVVGGGMVGIEVCEYLHHNKKGNLNITLLEMTDQIGGNMPVNNLLPTMKRLQSQPLQILVNSKLVEVCENNTVIIEQNNVQKQLQGFTHIIYACGAKAENTLYENFKDKVKEIYCIGDAKDARQALEAVAEGVNVALKI